MAFKRNYRRFGGIGCVLDVWYCRPREVPTSRKWTFCHVIAAVPKFVKIMLMSKKLLTSGCG